MTIQETNKKLIKKDPNCWTIYLTFKIAKELLQHRETNLTKMVFPNTVHLTNINPTPEESLTSRISK